MNGFNILEVTLRDILLVINPSREDRNVRSRIINELRAVVESIEILRGATVEPFGSFVSNLFTKWGDLDLSVELPNGSYISSPEKKRQQSLLRDVLKALRSKGGWRKLQLISNARVPILKFEGRGNISCDVSINNLSGQMKSKLLFQISGIDGRFRDLVLLVKEWAKAHNINDARSGTFNSHTLSLLVVFHLQTLEPAILPPLGEIYPGNMIDDLTGVRAVAEKRIEETCAVNINRIKSDRSRLINRSSLSELFISFLARLFEICSRASVQGVSPYAGRWEDIDSMRWWPRTYALYVEDPFEQPVNTARAVGRYQLTKILEAAWATHQVLVSSYHNQTSLIMNLVRPQISHLVLASSNHNQTSLNMNLVRPQISHLVLVSSNHNQTSLNMNLVRPQISHLVARTPVRHQTTAQSMPRTPSNNYIREGLGSHQHAWREQIPGQLEQDFEKMRVENSRIGTMTGEGKASTSQRQQVWKPVPE